VCGPKQQSVTSSKCAQLVELMDAGVRVVGVRFDRLVAEHARMSWDTFVRSHAERICGDRYAKTR
jgi:hypothetical protein